MTHSQEDRKERVKRKHRKSDGRIKTEAIMQKEPQDMKDE